MRLFRSLRDLDANFTYGYDNAGLPLSVVAVAQGIGRPWEARLQHDLLGRETLRTMTDGVGRPSRQSVTRGGHSLYNRSCQLREDRRWRYHYDKQGNLVLKTKRKISPVAETPQGDRKSVFGLFSGSNTSKERREQEELIAWHPGDYAYTWLPNGMLGSVTRPDGKVVTFKYDALGRRIEKTFNGRVHRYLWDGDVVLHEWEYDETERPQQIVAENGEVSFDRPEPTDNLVTWVYDTDSYVPTAKLVNGKRYGIVSDYIGRPVQAYDEHGTVVWQADYDIYGNLLNLKGDRKLVPFRQLGQYEDEETGLYYNRYRYYDCNTVTYISQDPISIAGGLNVYAYVHDSNTLTDILGLSPDIPLAGAGEDLFVGTYNQVRAGNIKSGLNSTHTPHHVVQDALSQTTHGKGITINLRKDLHELTRTYRVPIDKSIVGLRNNLAADVKDVKNILLNAGYDPKVVNRQLQELIRQNKDLGGFDKPPKTGCR